MHDITVYLGPVKGTAVVFIFIERGDRLGVPAGSHPSTGAPGVRPTTPKKCVLLSSASTLSPIWPYGG